MEVKLQKQQQLSSPDKQDSRGMKIFQYLTRTVSGKDLKSPSSSMGGGVPGKSNDVSDNEDGDEDVDAQGQPSDTARPSLLQRLTEKLAKGEPAHPDASGGNQNESVYGRIMSKNVIEVSKGVAADIKGSILQMKSLLLSKLASMPSIPTETFEHARHSIESIVSDATHSAYGMSKEVMSRIRLKLAEIAPSLSPHETKKIMDDVEREMGDMSKEASEESGSEEKLKKAGTVGISASATSAVMRNQPSTGVPGVQVGMDRLRPWTLLRSRL